MMSVLFVSKRKGKGSTGSTKVFGGRSDLNVFLDTGEGEGVQNKFPIPRNGSLLQSAQEQGVCSEGSSHSFEQVCGG
jgi:hypothetical protein